MLHPVDVTSDPSPAPQQFVAGLRGIEPGTADPRWKLAENTIRSAIARGDLEFLDEIWPELGNLGLRTLASEAWRGRMLCGPAGARAFLRSTDAFPAFERASFRDDSTLAHAAWGGLLGCHHDSEALGDLVEAAVTHAAADVLKRAIEERVLRDGAVTEDRLRAWPRVPEDLEAHEWERDLLLPQPEGFRYDTLGNIYFRRKSPTWPEGTPESSTEPTLTSVREWGVDEDFDLVGPDGATAPVGPFSDPALYPNGTTWCIEARTDLGDVASLSLWPFPREHLDVGIVAQEVDARALFREWLWRGLSGGAYGRGRGAARARMRAWEGLAALTGVDGSRPDIADAASALRVWGFRSRGPSVERLGGDLGWVVRRRDGAAWAAAHSDSD